MGFARGASPRRSEVRRQKKTAGHPTARAHREALARQLEVRKEVDLPKRKNAGNGRGLSVREQARLSAELCRGGQNGL